MYGKLYLVDQLLVYVQYFSIRYLMCAVMTNYVVYCMHALTVTSRPKLYIFNVISTPVSLFLNLCSSEFTSRLALLGSSIGIQACPLSRVSGSLVDGLRSRRLSKKFDGMPRYLSASTANITPFAYTDKAQLTSDYE